MARVDPRSCSAVSVGDDRAVMAVVDVVVTSPFFWFSFLSFLVKQNHDLRGFVVFPGRWASTSAA